MKLARLVANTELLLERAEGTGREMASLVGHWSWAFMPRRGAFSVFNAVYRFIETAGRRVFDVWPTVARALLTALALAPMFFSSLRGGWFPEAVASDASESGMEVVAAARHTDQCARLARRECLPARAPLVPCTPRCMGRGGRRSSPAVGGSRSTSTSLR
jgi:hypothetical protein